MQNSLPADMISNWLARARPDTAAGEDARAPDRQPVHTVYGGAHLFRAETASKLGALARRAFETYAPTPRDLAEIVGLKAGTDLPALVHHRITEKLQREPIEDYRIDFEDGYGYRDEAEEDEHAVACADELARAMEEDALPPIIGFRVKSFRPRTRARSLRTLDLLLTRLAGRTGGRPPAHFLVTLPKVDDVEAVATFSEAIACLEEKCGFPADSIRTELMVETPGAIIGPDGTCPLRRLVDAAAGRCVAAHFGAYDYTAALQITASCQRLHHPACEFARQVMQTALAGTNVRLSDGATNVLPIEPHRPGRDGPPLREEQQRENRQAVHDAWRLSYEDIRRSLAAGFYQGWDLHPGQLPIRYAAVYCLFLEGLADASARLRQFIEQAARATRVGNVFDDAATGQGLLNFFRRALNCGAITEHQLAPTGLTAGELRRHSFTSIVDERAKTQA
ncbi:MAG: phosphoenolpyruvate kinase [Planctomycetota bacterium]|nr:phosphoenolpyruvate kinase [Planctomycetota bacterium]